MLTSLLTMQNSLTVGYQIFLYPVLQQDLVCLKVFHYYLIHIVNPHLMDLHGATLIRIIYSILRYVPLVSMLNIKAVYNLYYSCSKLLALDKISIFQRFYVLGKSFAL